MNGHLVRTFDDVFGWLHAWKGYKEYNIAYGCGKNAWQRLDKKIVETISWRVVSLVSFSGDFQQLNHYFSYWYYFMLMIELIMCRK